MMSCCRVDITSSEIPRFWTIFTGNMNLNTVILCHRNHLNHIRRLLFNGKSFFPSGNSMNCSQFGEMCTLVTLSSFLDLLHFMQHIVTMIKIANNNPAPTPIIIIIMELRPLTTETIIVFIT